MIDHKRVIAREVANLREVFDQIADALYAAGKRLTALEAAVQVPNEREADDPPLGAQLRARRLALDLTQDSVARAAFLSRGLVSDLETGRRRSPEARLALLRTLERLEERTSARRDPGIN